MVCNELYMYTDIHELCAFELTNQLLVLPYSMENRDAEILVAVQMRVHETKESHDSFFLISSNAYGLKHINFILLY